MRRVHLAEPTGMDWTLTERHEHAADAGDASGHHGREEDPSPAPSVHQVPADEVGRHLDGAADEKALQLKASISAQRQADSKNVTLSPMKS